jgi:hypothetical protein
VNVLLDENIAQRFWSRFGEHGCKTVAHMGWRTFTNGHLLRLAESSGFEVFLTADQNLAYQQNLTERTIAIIVLNTNDRALIEANLSLITEAIAAAKPGSFLLIDCRR